MKSYSISQRKKSRGNRTWYGREFEDGLLVREISLKTKNRQEAMDWLNMMNAARFMPEEVRSRLAPKDHPLRDAVVSFLRSVDAAHGNSGTPMAYRYRIRAMEEWAAGRGVVSIRDFTVALGVEFAAFVSDRYAPKTAREVLRCCDQLFTFADRTFGLGGYNPLSGVTLPKVPKRDKPFWTPEQVDRILDATADPGYRLFFALMAFAGLRHAEACRFGPSSLRDGRIEVIGKGDKQRFVPVSARLEAEFERFGELCDGMFRTAKYNHPDRSNGALRVSVEAAGVGDSSTAVCHRFRHSFVSNLLRGGAPVKAVQQLAGHASAKMTLDTYSHVLEQDLGGVVDLLK